MQAPNKILEPIELHDTQKKNSKNPEPQQQQNAFTHPSLTQHHVTKGFTGQKSASYQITFWWEQNIKNLGVPIDVGLTPRTISFLHITLEESNRH